MCGITGFIETPGNRTGAELEETAAAMAAQLRHRGPNDQGVWVEPRLGLGLGHRRLSIIDLSPQGHQPMLSASERYAIVFNGEIYNHLDLRMELVAKGHSFRGHSDTETMLEAFDEWGIDQSLPRFTGMFAFAVWDRRTESLHLVRDRLGMKPLYYGWGSNCFLFGSELKTLRAHPHWTGRINRASLALLLRYNCIPAPHSIYERTYKLYPGCHLVLTRKQAGTPPSFSPLPTTEGADVHELQPRAYWSLREVA